MNASNHSAEFEALTAWLDGELAPADAERVRAHVAGCSECQQMEDEMQGIRGRLASWQVEDAPATLAAPVPHRAGRRLSTAKWLPIAAGLVVVAGAGVMWVVRNDPSTDRAAVQSVTLAEPGTPPELSYHERLLSAAPDQAQRLPGAENAANPALLVRTARLTLLIAGDIDAARARMERIVSQAGGFTGRIALAQPRGAARMLSATLRVPTAKLDETLAALRQIGQVTAESQEGEDVAQQSTDLDARLSNARASESRLKEIMDKRTGKLADVLAVENEIARVRGEIERMEAERKTLDRRIAYGVITIEISEERQAAVDLGPLPVSTLLRNAVVDGWTTAVNAGLNATLVILRVAPVLTFGLVVLAFPAWLVRRRLGK